MAGCFVMVVMASRSKKPKASPLATVVTAFTVLVPLWAGAAIFPGTNWETRTPPQAGLDVAKLNAIQSYLGGRGCIVRNGYLVYSWGNMTTRGDVASAAKPWYSTLLFKAVEEGRLASLDTRAVEFEPRLGMLNSPLGFKDTNITFRHFANQTSCYGVQEHPGAAYDYNDWQMALFWDTLFLNVYGATYATVDATVLQPRLTSTLQCQDSPTFMAFGTGDRPGRLAVSPRDFARFGLLYLNQGNWNGTQVISQAHARMAVTNALPLAIPRTAGVAAGMIPGQRTIGSTTVPDNQTDHDGCYSWLWWVNGIQRNGLRRWPDAPTDVFTCLGHANGQRGIAVMPSEDIVISWNDTTLGSRPADPHPLNPVFQYIMEAITNTVPQPMVGQIIVDPEHPNRMVYNGVYQEGRLKPCFFAGPGDPEDFFYNNTTNNLSLLKARGARCTYITAYLADFGGGSPGSGAAFTNTLNAWENHITELENAGIITVFFFFDDSVSLPSGWETAVDAIVNKFKHHKLLIWSVAEEYAEALTTAQVSTVAERIKAANNHAHIIGVHQNTGTSFAFNSNTNLQMFMIQNNVTTAGAVHGGLLDAWANTSGQKILNMSEIEDHAKKDRATVRQWNWAAAMGGASAVQVLWMGRASDPADWNAQEKYDDCARLMAFMESATLLNTLSPRDDLAFGATQWVLAKPGHAYIAYATNSGAMGLKSVTAGTYRFRWLDIPSGTMVQQTNIAVSAGDQSWPRPPGIGDEAAVYLVNDTFNVSPDTTTPEVQSATATGVPTQVVVVFSEPVEASSATLLANYALVQQTSGVPLNISNASLSGDGRMVTLVTSPMSDGTIYVLTVNGVRDLAVPPNTIATNTQAQFTYSVLRAFYRFEESSGTTTADASGNNLTGTLLNGPQWVPGKLGQYALNFDGSNDRVDLGNPALLQFTGALTVAAWVWPVSLSDNGRIITKGGGSGNRGWSLNVENSGVWAFQIASSSTALASLQVGSVPLNTWTHVAGVYDPSGTPSMKLYTNGVLAATLTTGVPAAQYNSGMNVSIGARADGTTRWNGRIDEVRLYARALSAAEVATLPEPPVVRPMFLPPHIRKQQVDPELDQPGAVAVGSRGGRGLYQHHSCSQPTLHQRHLRGRKPVLPPASNPVKQWTRCAQIHSFGQAAARGWRWLDATVPLGKPPCCSAHLPSLRPCPPAEQKFPLFPARKVSALTQKGGAAGMFIT